jgi:hypothetical protein
MGSGVDTPFVLAEAKQSPLSSTQHRLIELKQQIVQKQQSIRREPFQKNKSLTPIFDML